MKKIICITALFMLSACANNAEQAQATARIAIEPTIVMLKETPIPPAYLPLSSDSQLTKAKAMIDSASLIFTTGDPVQVELIMNGYLPTPCHELRIHIPKPDAEGNIMAEVYSVAESEIICAQVLRAFHETIMLGTYPQGSYLVWINGRAVGNFDF